MAKKRGCIQDFDGETWRKEQLVRTWTRWEDNIKIDLKY
jgi:hypothetical protein